VIVFIQSHGWSFKTNIKLGFVFILCGDEMNKMLC